jgi:hypothetical protein
MTHQQEKWKTVKGFEDYKISNFGRIKSLKNNRTRILKHGSNPSGYCISSFFVNGKQFSFLTHRLVASHFLTNYKSKKEVNHRDGDKKNNHVFNLEWATRSENMKHACDTKLLNCRKKVGNLHGEIFESSIAASLFYGLSEGAIRSAISREVFTADTIWFYLKETQDV